MKELKKNKNQQKKKFFLLWVCQDYDSWQFFF